MWDTINNPKLAEELRNQFPNTIKNDSGLNNNYDEFIKTNNFILMGDRLLNSYRYYHLEVYFEFIRNNIKDKKITDHVSIDLSKNIRDLIGFDKADNTYWIGEEGNHKAVISVFSKYGEVLDSFYDPVHKQFIECTRVDESTGDVYHWTVEKTGVTFYRTKNTWDPIDTTAKVSDSSTTKTVPAATFAAKATALIATSCIDYKDMYTPYRVFDGDPKTAWLEAAKGSGIDESVTLTLDKEIAIDEIRVMPGLFDTQWWKANNRIKKLVAVAADQTFTFNLTDKMEEQGQKLTAPLKLTKIKFTIKDVYRSSGDDDTALSEISFYNAGKKVEIDMSEVK